MNIRPFNNLSPQLSKNVFVDETAVLIGEVVLAEDVSVWPMAVLRADLNYINVGVRSNVQDGAVLHVVPDYEYCKGGLGVDIGEDVTIGHGAILHGCKIGNRCLIGMNATVLDGAVIEDEVIVAANSLVAPGKVLERGYIYIGNPARQARKLKPEEIQQIKENARLYVELKNQYL